MPAKPSEHITLTIYQLLWGSKLSSHPFTFEDDPVNFSSLWSDKRHFVEIYKEANLEQGCYDLCSLLAVTNSIRCLTALLKDGAIHVNHSFGADFGNMTLAHLACALGSADFVEILLNQKASQKGIWAITDDESMYLCVWEGCGGGVGGWEWEDACVCVCVCVAEINLLHTIATMILTFRIRRSNLPSQFMLYISDQRTIIELLKLVDLEK